MKSTRRLPRRHFLRNTSAAATLAGVLGQSMSLAASGAENSAAAAKGEQKLDAVEAVLADIENKNADFLSVARKDGQFLQLLIEATHAKSVLEIGTSRGYATLWIARALEETNGKLTTIEIVPERVQLAKTHVAKAGLSARVEFLQGDAHQIVTTLKGPFDFVFIDADKERERDYVDKLLPDKIARGAVVAAHNAIQFKDKMKDYLDRVTQHPEFETVIVSVTMDDGFAVSYRRRG